MFHGSSGTGEQFLQGSGWREQADATGLVAVFPTGLRYRVLDNGRRSTKWNTFDLADEVDLDEKPAGLPGGRAVARRRRRLRRLDHARPRPAAADRPRARLRLRVLKRRGVRRAPGRRTLGPARRGRVLRRWAVHRPDAQPADPDVAHRRHARRPDPRPHRPAAADRAAARPRVTAVRAGGRLDAGRPHRDARARRAPLRHDRAAATRPRSAGRRWAKAPAAACSASRSSPGWSTTTRTRATTTPGSRRRPSSGSSSGPTRGRRPTPSGARSAPRPRTPAAPCGDRPGTADRPRGCRRGRSRRCCG